MFYASCFMKILVTGGAGFIGSHLVDALVAAGHQVVVVDNLRTGKREQVNSAAVFENVDIVKPTLVDVVSEHKPEVIFHLAAQGDVRYSVTDPVPDAEINILGSVNLLHAARQRQVRRIIFSSSGGAIYGDTAVRPTPETHPAAPASPYGIGKLTVEHYLRVERQFGLSTISLRYGNVYGPRQRADGEAGVVAIFADRLLRGQPAVINGDGAQTRDFVYVADVVAANLAALASAVEGEFNIGTGREVTIRELAAMLRQQVGRGDFTHGPAKPGEQQTSSLDCSLARRTLGWQPTVTLEEGIANTVAWFRQQRASN